MAKKVALRIPVSEVKILEDNDDITTDNVNNLRTHWLVLDLVDDTITIVRGDVLDPFAGNSY